MKVIDAVVTWGNKTETFEFHATGIVIVVTLNGNYLFEDGSYITKVVI